MPGCLVEGTLVDGKMSDFAVDNCHHKEGTSPSHPHSTKVKSHQFIGAKLNEQMKAFQKQSWWCAKCTTDAFDFFEPL